MTKITFSGQRTGKRAQFGISGGYHGADVTRLTQDWQPWGGTADFNLGLSYCNLRERSRQMERDNDYFRRFLNALENNVLGHDGINLQMKVRDRKGMDKGANYLIENGWKKWGRRQFCSLNQEDCWVEVQKLVLRSTARDGGIFFRHVTDKTNPFGYTLELIEIDQLDTNLTLVADNGNRIFMGVEKNGQNRVVAYHMLPYHPGDRLGYNNRERERIPADGLRLYYVKERVSQSIGIPWACSAMTRMHFLNKYEEAELIAARAGAEKGGWFQSERGDSFEGETEESTDEDGNTITNTFNDFEPHSFDELPAGMTFVPYDPKHPNQAYGDFVKNTLLGISSGLNIDFATLTNDLSNANYSSMRSGKLESQETWKGIQGHFIRNFVNEVFEHWLMSSLDKGVIFPEAKRTFDDYNSPLFRGRRWPWVDPSKDVKAAIEAINNGLDTRTNVVAQNGADFEDIVDTVADENTIMEDAGVSFGEPAAPDPTTDGESTQNADGGIESLKQEIDAYGVGVRAGTLTPTIEDENYFRERIGLPPLSQSAMDAWSKEKNVRRPITLTQPGADGAASGIGQQASQESGEEDDDTEDDQDK